MAGAYLTKVHRQQILESNWTMVISEIQSAVTKVIQKPRLMKQLPMLQAMLKAAQAWEADGVIKPARTLCRLTNRVPPGTYYQSTKTFKFSGQRVTLPKDDTAWSLALVHPQIYR